MNGLIDELKRRNVVRAAIAYLVVAWLLVDISATTFPMLRLPDWAATLVTVLLIVGFPIALIFSWAFDAGADRLHQEDTSRAAQSTQPGSGRKRDQVIIGILATVLLLLAVDWITRFLDVAPTVQVEQTSAAEDNRQSIAVLPFVNMSPDTNQEFFSDGLAEEILNLLAQIPDLKVIGRTSSFAFKGKNEDLRLIGQALGVRTLLEGSVRRSGEQIRITAQLIDAATGAHIWSSTFNRDMTEIFALQDEFAAAIIDALQVHVGTNPSRGRPTDSAQAYALFLKARELYNDVQHHAAEQVALQAIELDPGFAEAYELLAYVYWSYGGNSMLAAEAQELMGDTAAKALAINPDLIFARAMYQSGDFRTYSHSREIQALERAEIAAPNNSWVKDALFFDLVAAGYVDEAIDLAKRSVALEPLSASANNRLFEALYSAGRIEEAMATLEIVMQLRSGSADWGFAATHLAEGRDDAAIALIEADLERNGLPANWVREMVRAARKPETGQAYLDSQIPVIVASMPKDHAYRWQNNLTYWYLYFGFLDRYFDLILDGELTDSNWTDAQNRINRGTVYRHSGFTSHPKYLVLAEAIGITDVWQQRGEPDFCKQTNGKWAC